MKRPRYVLALNILSDLSSVVMGFIAATAVVTAPPSEWGYVTGALAAALAVWLTAKVAIRWHPEHTEV